MTTELFPVVRNKLFSGQGSLKKTRYPPCIQKNCWGYISGGLLRISSDGDDRRIFLGLKFSILEFFGVGKFDKYFFAWLDW